MTRRVRPTGQGSTDGGFTLVELLTAMSIFLVVIGIFTASYTGILKGVTKENGYVDAQAQTRQAFETMDRQVRYADGITTASVVDGTGTQWIEWEVPDATIATNLSPTHERCYQWRSSTSTGTLQYRSWLVNTGTVTPSAWATPLAGLVATSQPVFTTSTAGLVASPFGLPSPAASQSVGLPLYNEVGVVTTVKRNNPAGSASSNTVFTALNDPVGPPAAGLCAQVARS